MTTKAVLAAFLVLWAGAVPAQTFKETVDYIKDNLEKCDANEYDTYSIHSSLINGRAHIGVEWRDHFFSSNRWRIIHSFSGPDMTVSRAGRKIDLYPNVVFRCKVIASGDLFKESTEPSKCIKKQGRAVIRYDRYVSSFQIEHCEKLAAERLILAFEHLFELTE